MRITRRNWLKACALARGRRWTLSWYDFLAAAGKFQRVRW